MCLEIDFAIVEFMLPGSPDVPLAHRAFHELRPNEAELETVRELVNVFIKLAGKIMGDALQIGDAGPDPIVINPDCMDSFVSHVSAMIARVGDPGDQSSRGEAFYAATTTH